MFNRIIVHPRVQQRHPEIENSDVETAWKNAIAMHRRTYDPPDYFAAAGFDSKNRLLEMVGVETESEDILIFHAMRLTDKMRFELGL